MHLQVIHTEDFLIIHHYLTTSIGRQVEYLMRHGVDPCSPSRDGTSPIHKAALLESPSGPSIVSSMLSYGADPNIRTATGINDDSLV